MVSLSLQPLDSEILLRPYRNPTLDFLSLHVFDPILLQATWVVVLSYVFYRVFKAKRASWTDKWYALTYPIFVIVLLIFLELLLEKYLLKPIFSYNRPGTSYGEPWLTSLLRPIFHFSDHKGTSTPSGFIVRQTVLALLFVILIT